MSWSRLKMAKELHFYLFLLGDGVFSSKSKQLFFFFFSLKKTARIFIYGCFNLCLFLSKLGLKRLLWKVKRNLSDHPRKRHPELL